MQKLAVFVDETHSSGDDSRYVSWDFFASSLQTAAIGSGIRVLLSGTQADAEEQKGEPLSNATITKTTLPSPLQRACLAARTARDQKGKNILVLDMKGLHPLYDFFILATGSSRRQLHNLAEEIDSRLQAVGDQRIGIEGYQSSKWIVQDYTDLLVHVFDPATREYYALEELWADAPRIDWENQEEDPVD
ncbi:MAG: ribosome silencing factor [Zavarzinella sp.]